ncbi:MAG: cupredoxin domain-containing protein [Candidatus Acidiferrales bacterium]
MTGKRISRIAVSAALLATLGWTATSRAKLPARGGQEQAAGAQVKIDNFSFTPQEMTVAAGTKVTWVNHDDIPHTVVSTNEAFKSKALDTDDRFTFTFEKAGTYDYFCSIHSKMTARIVVK